MLGDPGFCFGKLAGLQLVTPFLCDRSHANDAGFLENAQMARYGGPRAVESFGNPSGRQRSPTCQHLDDASPRWIGQRRENVHDYNVAYRLRSCQATDLIWSLRTIIKRY